MPGAPTPKSTHGHAPPGRAGRCLPAGSAHGTGRVSLPHPTLVKTPGPEIQLHVKPPPAAEPSSHARPVLARTSAAPGGSGGSVPICARRGPLRELRLGCR